MATQFNVGDIVRYKASFLRSVGWYTNVPDRGEVVSTKSTIKSLELIKVKWPGDAQPMSILSSNLVLAGRLDPSC